jgi:hypothetical protein
VQGLIAKNANAETGFLIQFRHIFVLSKRYAKNMSAVSVYSGLCVQIPCRTKLQKSKTSLMVARMTERFHQCQRLLNRNPIAGFCAG